MRQVLQLTVATLVLHVIGWSNNHACGEQPRMAFRVRSDFGVNLNADDGWAGQLNEDVTVLADQPFRIRFEVESGPGSVESVRLQYRRNGGGWSFVEAYDFPNPAADALFDFSTSPLGLPPMNWTVVSGKKSDLAVTTARGGRILSANAESTDLIGLCPWPTALPEFELAVQFRLPMPNASGFSLVFGLSSPTDYYSVAVDAAQGAAIVKRRVDGEETEIARHPVDLILEQWMVLSIELEDSDLTVAIGDREFQTEIEETVDLAPVGFLVPADSSAEFKQFVMQGAPRTPNMSIVSCSSYTNDDATTDLLKGSRQPFRPGKGISFAKAGQTPMGGAGHSEFEWPLVVRYFADGPVKNEAQDLFEVRLVTPSGRPVASAHPKLRLAIPPRHLGGTFVETPGRIGPWRTKRGDLYFIMEPTETDNVFMMVKSTDEGLTWREVDAANRPRTNDLESVDARQVGATIHIVHQVTEATYYHVFHTSDHLDTPDSWSVRDDPIAHIPAHSQAATLARRSNGNLVAFFVGEKTIHYSVRSSGTWSSPAVLDSDEVNFSAGPQAILGDNEEIHVAYCVSDGTIWCRTLQANGQLGSRRLVATGAGETRAEYDAVLPLLHIPEKHETLLAYRLASGELWERRIQPGGGLTKPVQITKRQVVQNAVDSQQPGADIVLDGTTVHLLFIEESSRAIFHTNDRDGWQPAQLRVDNILGSWVRGSIYRRMNGTKVYGFVYDAGSDGGSGLNRFASVGLLDAD